MNKTERVFTNIELSILDALEEAKTPLVMGDFHASTSGSPTSINAALRRLRLAGFVIGGERVLVRRGKLAYWSRTYTINKEKWKVAPSGLPLLDRLKLLKQRNREVHVWSQLMV